MSEKREKMRKNKSRRKRAVQKLDKEINREFLKQLKIENVLFEANYELDSERVKRLRDYIT